MAVYYFGVVGAMVSTQVMFFQASSCKSMAFVRYYWLAVNIGLFYVFIAYGISLWGAYICWAQEEEENITKDALKWKFDKMIREGKENQAQLMLDA